MQVGLQAAVHYNFLIALWNSSRDGRQIIDARYTIMLLSLPKKVYDRLVKKFELNGDLRQLVLQVYLDGEVKYQVMNFEVDNTKKPPYMQDKALFEQIKQEVLSFKQYIPYVVGSVIDEKTFWELWNKEGQATEQYNPNEQQFRNRGMVGQGSQQQPQRQLPDNRMQGGGGQQGQYTNFEVVQQGNQGGQGGQHAGTLKTDDFNFDEANSGGGNQGGQGGQGGGTQGGGQGPQNVQQSNQGGQGGNQNRPVNQAAEQANNVDKSGAFFNNGGDFNFES